MYVAIKDKLLLSMQDELEDNQEEYYSLAHEYWCGLLYTIKFKDNRKRSVTQIKRLATYKSSYYFYSNEYIRFPRKKRVSTGVIPNRKQQGRKIPKHHGIQRYCVLYKKAGIYEQKYMSHSSENCFVKCYNQQYIKYGLRVVLGNRSDAVKQHKILKKMEERAEIP